MDSDVIIYGGMVALIAATSIATTLFFLKRGGFICPAEGHKKGAATTDFNPQKRKAEDACARLGRKVWELQSKRDLIEVYKPEYYNTLQEAGLFELTWYIEELNQLGELLNKLMNQGDYSTANVVANYLLGTLPEAERREVKDRFASLSELENWREATDTILKTIALRLDQAATETKNIGVVRDQRKRKPTLVMASELLNEHTK